MLTTHERNANLKLLSIVVSILVVAGVVVHADHQKGQDFDDMAVRTTSAISSTAPSSGTSSNPPAATTNPTTPDGSSSSASTSGLKDGTYTGGGSYFVPHGKETVRVSVTLQNGVIAASSIQNSEGDRASAMFQQEFAAVYKSHVVGQKISGLQLSTLAGASDTTAAFNEALQQIVSEAQA